MVQTAFELSRLFQEKLKVPPNEANELVSVIEKMTQESHGDYLTQKDKADLTKEISTVRIDLTKEIASVRTDLTKEISTVRMEITSVRTDLMERIDRNFKWTIVMFLGVFGTLITLALQIIAKINSLPQLPKP